MSNLVENPEDRFSHNEAKLALCLCRFGFTYFMLSFTFLMSQNRFYGIKYRTYDIKKTDYIVTAPHKLSYAAASYSLYYTMFFPGILWTSQILW